MGKRFGEEIHDTLRLRSVARCQVMSVIHVERGCVGSAARVGSDQTFDFCQIARFPRIVPVQQGGVLSAGFLHGPVAGGAYAPVLLLDQPDEGRADLLDPGGASVGRTVVHDDDFKRLRGLCQHRTEGAGDLFLFVIEGNDDRNIRFHSSIFPGVSARKPCTDAGIGGRSRRCACCRSGRSSASAAVRCRGRCFRASRP